MGKCHVGLTYSQEINEVLDRLSELVRNQADLVCGVGPWMHIAFVPCLVTPLYCRIDSCDSFRFG